ncbi:MAG: NifU family protein [Chloroflexota bacterium]|nr:NifU family protein [Chloroflexota bacterium]
MMQQGNGFEQRMERLDALIQETETFTDPAARAVTEEVVQALLELHGSSIERMLEIVVAAGDAGEPIMAEIIADDKTRNLLLLHGLHPVAMEERVRQALDRVRPYMASHGGYVELRGIEEGVVYLRLEGSCHGCPSSLLTLQLSIEKEIMALAPDVAGIEVEGLAEAPTAPQTIAPDGFVPIASFATVGMDG